MQNKRTQSKRRFSQAALDRAVASSTAIEAGQSVAEIERLLSRPAEEHQHITLAPASKRKCK